MSLYSALILATPSLQAYWRLGEATGTTTADEVGSVTGTLVNTPTLAASGAIASDSNTAMSFTAASLEYINFGNFFPFTGTASFSIEMWIKYAVLPVGYESLLTKQVNSGAFGGWGLAWNAGLFDVFRYESGGERAAALAPPLAGAWTHIVATYNGTNLKLYQNGVLQSTVASSRSISTGSDAIFFGRASGGTNYFNGTADEIAVYDAAIDAATIFDHYALGASGAGSTAVTIRSKVNPPWPHATGDLPYHSASTGWQSLPRPSVTSVLTHDGATGPPEWAPGTVAFTDYANAWSVLQDFNGAYLRHRRTSSATPPTDLLPGEVVLSTSATGDIWMGIS